MKLYKSEKKCGLCGAEHAIYPASADGMEFFVCKKCNDELEDESELLEDELPQLKRVK